MVQAFFYHLALVPERPGDAGNTVEEFYSKCRNAKSIQTSSLTPKISMTADEVVIDKEMHAMGGMLRRKNVMGLQGWSSSEMSQLCRISTCGNPI